MSAALLSGSLVVILLSAVAAPLPLEQRAGGGVLLLALWAYAAWTKRAAHPTSPLRLIPGVALAFFGLALVEARPALLAWAAAPPLIFALDQARLRAWWSLSVAVYVILWFDLFALVHQLVAVGRELTGIALLSWSLGLGVVVTAYVTLGVVRVLKELMRGDGCDRGCE
ncbi:MAG: hypothetical protein R6U88_04580 [Candidatus Bipolaricaulota bacterium]